MKVTCIGHSGFSVEFDNLIMVFDYYQDETHVIDSILSSDKPIIVFSSHFHKDHFQKCIFEWSNYNIDVSFVLSYDILKRIKGLILPAKCSVLRPGNVINLNDGVKIHAFASTDSGCSFIVCYENKVIFHSGDLNNWCWKDESTQGEIRKANSDFLKIVGEIDKSYHSVDLAMFPVDARMGTDYFIGAKQFVHTLAVRNFIPMHFWQYQKEACQFSLYRNINYGNYICLTEPGSSIEII